MITFSADIRDQMVAHCLKAYPIEGCGLLAATPGTDQVELCLPVSNASTSARIYTIDPKDMMRADRVADEEGLEIVAVFHSHTHTEAYPSPTDVAQAPVPEWHYLLISFANTDDPDVKSYRIVDGNIEPEEIVLT